MARTSVSAMREKLCWTASPIGPAACPTPGTLPVRRYCTICSGFQPPMPLTGSEVMLYADHPASVEPAR